MKRVQEGGHVILAMSDLQHREEDGSLPSRWLDEPENEPQQEQDARRRVFIREHSSQGFQQPQNVKEAFKKVQQEAQELKEDMDAEQKASEEPEDECTREAKRRLLPAVEDLPDENRQRRAENLASRLQFESPGTHWILQQLEVKFSGRYDKDLFTEHEGKGYAKPAWDWPVAFSTSTESAADAKRLISLPYGLGTVTLVPSLRPFTNLRLDQHQHAALWQALILHPANEDGKLCFVRGSGVSFWALLWEKSWRFLLAAMAALLVWLWSVTKRFGLPGQLVDASLDSAQESLLASGEFLFRQQQASALLTPWRERLLARWKRRQPGGHELDVSHFIPDAAAASGLTESEVEECFTLLDKISPQHFHQLVQRLSKLESTLKN
jgi:hypothetical protein